MRTQLLDNITHLLKQYLLSSRIADFFSPFFRKNTFFLNAGLNTGLRKNIVFFLSLVSMGLLASSCSADTYRIAVELEETVSVSSIGIFPVSDSTNRIEISRGYFKQLSVFITPTNASNQNVTWKLETSVSGISIDQNGKVTVDVDATSGTNAVVLAISQADNTKIAKAYIQVAQPSPENMITVVSSLPSSAIIFPMKTDDSGSGSISQKFAMSQTEITWELWKKVYDWATTGSCSSSTGKGCYTFTSGFQAGVNIATTEDQQPVAKVNWRNSVIWCNAYTEWYNANKNPSTLLSVVYRDSSNNILRDATQKTGSIYDVDVATYNGAVVWNAGATSPAGYPGVPTSTGFRLPTSEEWEFTARLQKDTVNYVASVPYASGVDINGTTYYYTKGDSASGADENYSKPVTKDFAWYNSNADSKTHEVGLKNANDLNIFDMGGNLAEWCFDSYNANSTSRILRGGRWNGAVSSLRTGAWERLAPQQVSESTGFRVSQTLP